MPGATPVVYVRSMRLAAPRRVNVSKLYEFIYPAVDRVTFLESGHRERLTLVGIGAGVNL
jgi:hypothetical protein